MDNSVWEYNKDDNIGNSTKNAKNKSVWLRNRLTSELALFKPNDGRLSSGTAEIEAHRLAEKLGLSCAPWCRGFEWNGVEGVLIADFKIYDGRRYVQSRKFNIGEASKDFIIQSPFSDEQHVIGLTMSDIRNNAKFKKLEENVCDMIFFDCLTRGIDRHSKNVEIMIDSSGNIIGLAPLFDHSLTIFNPVVQNTRLNCSRFIWSREETKVTQFEMFKKLCEHYPIKTKTLLDRTQSIAEIGELDGLLLPSFDEMKNIYAKTQSFSNRYVDEPGANSTLNVPIPSVTYKSISHDEPEC